MEKAHKRPKRFYSYRSIDSEKLWELCETNETINEFNDYIGSYDVGIGDLYAIRNYGLTQRDNEPQIVILDSGLSDDIYNTYYNKQR